MKNHSITRPGVKGGGTPPEKSVFNSSFTAKNGQPNRLLRRQPAELTRTTAGPMRRWRWPPG
ncbi:hypothetical protein C2E15_19815 [Mixta gaviniae]|uniref:Uncharacterized protein n=1 Tax=Mixta gaviniae TaxID=665914 RepID=A0A2L0IKI1_9GAMM|nr:hypothetical protein C2E15_19815 [Mixta gaviniae]